MTRLAGDPQAGTNGERTPVSAATPVREQPVAGHPGVTAEGDRMRPSPPAGLSWFSTPPSELRDWDLPDGFHHEWVPNEGSRVATIEEHEGRRCRRPGCGGKPVMALWRSRHTKYGFSGNWWLYCARHMYGQRIENGVVQSRRAVANAPATGQGRPE